MVLTKVDMRKDEGKIDADKVAVLEHYFGNIIEDDNGKTENNPLMKMKYSILK